MAITGYRVYRNGTLIASPTTPSYTDSGLTNGVTYSYQVSAVSEVGEGPKSTSVSGTPAALPPPPPPPPATAALYGSGIQADAKNNYQVGWTLNARVSHRFRATTTSPITSIAINQRTGSGYSGGTGGTMKAALQADNGGNPNGTDLASVTFVTPNPGTDEKKAAHSVSGWPSLVVGTLYHVVFTNVDSSPTANYISINATCLLGGYSTNPRQPAFSDDYALLYNQGSGWSVKPDTAVMDLAHQDGSHTGNAYFQITVGIGDTYIGGSKMARERFTVTGGDRTISTLAFRVKRLSGSGLITLSLRDSGGSVIQSGTVASTGIPVSPTPAAVGGGHWDEGSLAGGRWAIVTIPPTTITNGQTYEIRISTDSSTSLMAIPLRRVSTASGSDATWASRTFHDGFAQQTNDGSSWTDTYDAYHDWQFYLR